MNDAGLCWLVVSSYDDPASVQQARDAGADGFVSKRDAGGELLETIRKVLSTQYM